MKVEQVQNNAKKWHKTLTPLNKSQEGQIPIVFKNAQGKKEQGYVALTDIELLVEGKKISVGDLLTDMLNMNMETLKKVKTIENGVAAHDKDMLIVKTDNLGYIKEITDFNNKVDLVVAKQVIPKDFNKGYYYVENGKIKLNESRKLELYPDFV